MDLNDLNKVWEIKPLKKVRQDEAREILEKVAKQVQPIMQRRKWKVKILSEFCPSNPALLGLNINGGAEVKLRLRMQNNEWDFFPYEQILDTMLHELCHNQYGPHNADFYNLLDEIRKECEELMSKGMDMNMMLGSGKRLGGLSRQPPLSSLRQKALSAAENRAERGSSGPRRVGGDSSVKAVLSPIQAAAMAAERRLRDDLWCASNEQPSSSQLMASALPSVSVSNHNHIGGEPEALWKCATCTLLNQPVSLTCEACGTQRAEEKSMKKMWSCKFCTLQNSATTERCMACGEWRYSYGPPPGPGPFT